MKEKLNKSRDAILEKINIPKDVTLNLPTITVLGNEQITIENHKGIMSFERNLIKINTKISPITIKGNNFEILYIGEATITISGSFQSIVYEGN